MKKSIILGVSGQDGYFLTKYLLSLNYKVYGMLRRHSVAENQTTRLDEFLDNPNFITFYGDITDESSINKIIKEVQPDELYNLAAMSQVRISYDIPQYTAQVNAIGVLNVLEAVKNNSPHTRVYQASSSEIFGDFVDSDGFQRETTYKRPCSPYGVTKLFGYHMIRVYRDSYKLHFNNGILFNHESKHRGSNFVTAKIIKGATRIKYGLQDKLYLGNLEAKRDWGWSGDYVKAMHLILQQETPNDYVVSSGETRTIKEMCEYVFKKLGMNYLDYVVFDKNLLRGKEVPHLKGDSSKIRDELGWEPIYTFEMLMEEMLEHWDKEIKLEVVKNGLK